MNIDYGRQDLAFATHRARRVYRAIDVADAKASSIMTERSRRRMDLRSRIVSTAIDIPATACQRFFGILGLRLANSSGDVSAVARRHDLQRAIRCSRQLARTVDVAARAADELIGVCDLASVSDSINEESRINCESIRTRIGSVKTPTVSTIGGIGGRIILVHPENFPIGSDDQLDERALRELMEDIRNELEQVRKVLSTVIAGISEDIKQSCTQGQYSSRRPSKLARSSISVAIRLLPRMQRPRYSAELYSQLQDLADSRSGSLKQLFFSVRMLTRVPQLRNALREPRHRSAMP